MNLTLDYIKGTFCDQYCQVQCDGSCDLKGMIETAFIDPLFAMAYRASPSKAMELLFERISIDDQEMKGDSKRPCS